jgi:hypothetical protein
MTLGLAAVGGPQEAANVGRVVLVGSSSCSKGSTNTTSCRVKTSSRSPAFYGAGTLRLA